MMCLNIRNYLNAYSANVAKIKQWRWINAFILLQTLYRYIIQKMPYHWNCFNQALTSKGCHSTTEGNGTLRTLELGKNSFTFGVYLIQQFRLNTFFFLSKEWMKIFMSFACYGNRRCRTVIWGQRRIWEHFGDVGCTLQYGYITSWHISLASNIERCVFLKCTSRYLVSVYYITVLHDESNTPQSHAPVYRQAIHTFSISSSSDV